MAMEGFEEGTFYEYSRGYGIKIDRNNGLSLIFTEGRGWRSCKGKIPESAKKIEKNSIPQELILALNVAETMML